MMPFKCFLGLIFSETSRSIEGAKNWDAGVSVVKERNVWDIRVKKNCDVLLTDKIENQEYGVYHSNLQVKEESVISNFLVFKLKVGVYYFNLQVIVCNSSLQVKH